MKIRSAAAKGTLIAAALVLASGRFLYTPSAEDMFPTLFAAGLLFVSAAAAVFTQRNPQRSTDRIPVFWICTGVLVSVQMTGGGESILYSAYFLFLMWVSLPSIGGGAFEFGILIGFIEAFALLNSTLWSGNGSFLPRLLPLLLPSLKSLLIPFSFGLVADWLSERETFTVDPGKRKEWMATDSGERPPPIGIGDYHSLLSILQRTAGSGVTCLFLKHDDGSFRLEKFDSEEDTVISKLILPENHRLLRVIQNNPDPVSIRVGSTEELLELAPYRHSIPTCEESFWILLCPFGNQGNPSGFLLQDFTDGKPSSESLQNLLNASETIFKSGYRADETISTRQDGMWMVKLIAASGEDSLDRAVTGIAGLLSELIPDSTVSIADVDMEGGKITVWVSRGPLARWRRKRISSSSEGLAGWIVKNRILCKRSRMKHGERRISSFSNEELLPLAIGSCLGVPILRDQQVTAIIIAEHEEDDAFSRYHENILMAAAGLLSLKEELSDYRNRISTISGRDILTGLPGITLFEGHLRQMVKKVQSYGWSIGVLVADIDGFDLINSNHSYRDGDVILREAADRFADCFSGNIFISRTGPDSFAACIPRAGKAEMEALCQRVADALAWKCTLNSSGGSVQITASVGGCYTHINRKVLALTGLAGKLVAEASGTAPGSYMVKKVGLSEST